MKFDLVPSGNHDKRSSDYRSGGRTGTRPGRGGTTEWVGIDGEGETDKITGEHRYVYLACGTESVENPNGLQWRDIFEFLYSQYRPGVAYVGFYLGYDFTQWLKSLSEDRAWKLFTIKGKTSRKSRAPALHGKYLPVDLDGWQVDILGMKRLAIRPKYCECRTEKAKCGRQHEKWMYICDAGPFFQCSFLQAIDPDGWPDNPVVTPEELATIVEGKARRSEATLDDEMRRYCQLEVDVLARVMKALDKGFRSLSITLSPKQWFGPGQAAQKWLLHQPGSLRTKEFKELCPEWFWEAARDSYFGGWFEIMAHGRIPGVCHEYDINSAYPAQIAWLPCLRHGKYSRGDGRPVVNSRHIAFVRARVEGKSNDVGAMMHRKDAGSICRPKVTEGWFEYRELQAALAAGTVSEPDIRYDQWVKYEPCDCPPPFADIAELYRIRLRHGKNTVMGKACKLVYNSCYGKFAQSVGNPTTSNPVYAALITAGCRRMILDAIAAMPHDTLTMVATDAVFFTQPNESLPISKELGQWDHKERHNLTQFKPGVYWDDEARAALADDELPKFKARGISVKDFAKRLAWLDEIYQRDYWLGEIPLLAVAVPDMIDWPEFTVETDFSMTTCLQALNMRKWETAGSVGSKPIKQSSRPIDKRAGIEWSCGRQGGGYYRSDVPVLHDDQVMSVPYEKKFGMEDIFSDDYLDAAAGVGPDESRPFTTMFRFLREGVAT